MTINVLGVLGLMVVGLQAVASAPPRPGTRSQGGAMGLKPCDQKHTILSVLAVATILSAATVLGDDVS
jgi:hypothetical protein